ncbi:hypothetical protein [Rathayibacter rathayi]|uniref:hypothetical protein n=1 Tax=Rathayibacter rathayi TaxID=33887 RepID=UPI0011B06078|nr:hypothetical protein [Rathayibacter rathayi]
MPLSRAVLLRLARGGRNRIRGRGFRRPYDDGTRGRARHVIAVAGVTLYLGGPLAHLLLRTIGGDARGSVADRLTSRAFRWGRLLRRGDVRVADAGAWIRREICHRGAGG